MARCRFCDHQNPEGATRCVGCGAEMHESLEPGHESLADTLKGLIRGGRKAEAIKVYRERTQSGLMEAQGAIEALERGEPLPSPESISVTIDQDVVSLVREGNKIAAIKLYREKTGVGLPEAKQAVDTLATEYGLKGQGSGCASVFVCALSIACFAAHALL